MASDEVKSADAQLASDVADSSLETPAETSKAADSLANGEQAEEGAEDEDEEEEAAEADETATTSPQKKKKKKGKKKKNKVGVEEAAATTEPAKSPPKPTQVHDIQSLLNQLSVSQSKEEKAPSDYKFWNTQPVPKFQEPNLLQTTTSSSGEAKPEGAILPDKICRASAKAEPGPMRDGFEWCLVDLENDEEVNELYELLDNHYVEDTEGSFRFKYSIQFLTWALKPPGWKKDWHIGVRTASKDESKKGKLVAFIAGIPVTLKVGENVVKATEINFLAVHRKLRGKRLAPELIKEVTRRCYLNDIYQALYTAGTLLPTPITTCRYFHRSLDWEHLNNTGFSHMPQGSTAMKLKYKYRLDSHTGIKGLRAMRKDDVPAVRDLLVRYLERFYLRQDWTDEEIEHWLCSEQSKGVVWCFVVEVEGKITDFVSYYLLEVSFFRNFIGWCALLIQVANSPPSSNPTTKRKASAPLTSTTTPLNPPSRRQARQDNPPHPAMRQTRSSKKKPSPPASNTLSTTPSSWRKKTTSTYSTPSPSSITPSSCARRSSSRGMVGCIIIFLIGGRSRWGVGWMRGLLWIGGVWVGLGL